MYLFTYGLLSVQVLTIPLINTPLRDREHCQDKCRRFEMMVLILFDIVSVCYNCGTVAIQNVDTVARSLLQVVRRQSDNLVMNILLRLCSRETI